MTNEIVVQPVSAIAIVPDQTSFTPTQVAALRQLGVQDAPEGDLAVFFHQCARTGLDPFAKQIYMIARQVKIRGRDGVKDRWETKYTIQTGIDGYRVLGHRLADERADELEESEPQWCGTDGQWVDVWVDPATPPTAARYVITKNGKPRTGTAMYAEFVQTTGNGEPNSMWSKMPANQLSKCAEAQAWRKTYPQDFSGMQLEDAVQIIDPDGTPVGTVRVSSRRVRAADIIGVTPAAEVSVEPVESDPATAQEKPAQATPAEQRELSDLLESHGHQTRDAKLAYLCTQTGRQISSATELTGEEARGIAWRLALLATTGQIDALKATLVNDHVHDEHDQIEWLQNNGAPGGFDDLPASLADRLTAYLLAAQTSGGDGA